MCSKIKWPNGVFSSVLFGLKHLLTYNKICGCLLILHYGRFYERLHSLFGSPEG